MRADRQFEFRQLDLELAFAKREDVLEVLERVVVASFEAVGREPPERPFPRLSYADAMLKYGSDKPDLRFGLEIQDATEVTRGSEFGVFAGAAAVRFLVAPKAFSRGDLAKLEDVREGVGGEGPRVPRLRREGEVRSPIAKFLSEPELDAFAAPAGSTVLFVADELPVVERVLGALRLHLGREFGLVDETRDAFHWLLDFPLFQLDEETGRWTFVHHPFTGPLAGHEELIERTRRTRSASTTTSSGTAGSSVRLDQDPPLGRSAAGLPRDGDDRGGGEREIRMVPRSAADGRPAARRVRAGSRPFPRVARGGAQHPRGHRVPEGVERGRSAHGSPARLLRRR